MSDAKTLPEEMNSLLLALQQSPLKNLQVANDRKLGRMSIFDVVPKPLKAQVLQLMDDAVAAGDVGLSRAMGAMTGMAVADSLGHNYEFVAVRDAPGDSKAYFEYPCSTPGGVFHEVYNKFRLAPGQWTDDTSMGLCLADSLLLSKGYNGTNLRLWFFNWWFNGLDNAFRLDKRRQGSVGLGGNIANSLQQIALYAQAGRPIPPRYVSDTEDAGNGSLMRLVPIALRYHTDIGQARAQAYESSLSTHPGKMAAEACAFMAHVLVRALHRPADSTQTAREFLDEVVAEYLPSLPPDATGAQLAMRRLLLSNEADTSTERCWNWRSANLGVERTLANRGNSYNGYPVSAGYFGAFSIDGLSMALHCMYNTGSFNEAVAKIVNMRGDADTTGSICAQMCGAFYGIGAVDPKWRADLHQWDQREIELRAGALYLSASP